MTIILCKLHKVFCSLESVSYKIFSARGLDKIFGRRGLPPKTGVEARSKSRQIQLAIVKSVMDCAGKVAPIVLVVTLPDGGVTVTLVGPTIWLRFALL